MGEVLRGPWGDPPAGSSDDERAGGPARSRRQRVLDDATPEQRRELEHAEQQIRGRFGERGGSGDEEPASATGPGADGSAHWAVPGVDVDGLESDQVDADEPVPLPQKAARRAENVSLAVLAGHDASAAEVRARLERKGLEPGEVAAELDRLARVGLLDDRALADRLIARLRERKGLGDGALRGALRQRHIPADIVDAAIADATQDPEALHDQLQQVADERARRLGGLPPEVAERRLLAYLQRKGYSGSEARDAARAALRPS